MDSNKNTTKDEKYQKTTIEFIHQIINQAENYVALQSFIFWFKKFKKCTKRRKLFVVQNNFCRNKLLLFIKDAQQKMNTDFYR